MSNETIQKASKGNEVATTRETWTRPHYEVTPGKENYELKVYLPGVPKKQAEVTIEKDQLLVIGRRGVDKPENSRIVHAEISPANFRLQLQLNVHIDADQIEAQSENGVLTVRLPLAEHSKPRAIAID